MEGPKTGLRLQSRDLSSLNKCPVGQCRSPPNSGQPGREASLLCSALPSVSRCGFIVPRTLPAIFLLLFLSCKFGNELAGERKCVMNDNADDPGTLSWQEAWPEEGSCVSHQGFQEGPVRLPPPPPRILIPSGCLKQPLGLCFTRAMAEPLSLCLIPSLWTCGAQTQLRA